MWLSEGRNWRGKPGKYSDEVREIRTNISCFRSEPIHLLRMGRIVVFNEWPRSVNKLWLLEKIYPYVASQSFSLASPALRLHILALRYDWLILFSCLCLLRFANAFLLNLVTLSLKSWFSYLLRVLSLHNSFFLPFKINVKVIMC